MSNKHKQHPSLRFEELFNNNNNEKLFKNTIFTYKARGAIHSILASLKKSQKGNKVLIPAFHCPTVVQPVLLAGFDVEFYQINLDLTIEFDDLYKRLNNNIACVLIINFFGFEQELGDLNTRCKTSDSLILEDCSHSLYNRNPIRMTGNRGDVSVFSFWKMIPSFVGGGYKVSSKLNFEPSVGHKLSMMSQIKIIKNNVEQILNNLPDKNIFKVIYNALENLRRFSIKGLSHSITSQINSRKMLGKYPIISSYFSDNIPWSSRLIIQKAPIAQHVDKIIANYNMMFGLLQENKSITPLLKKLPEQICPWCFPVLISNRSQYDYKLKKDGVNFFTFGETLHESINNPNVISEQAKEIAIYLSESILCLSIHQNINENDILHSVAKINELKDECK